MDIMMRAFHAGFGAAAGTALSPVAGALPMTIVVAGHWGASLLLSMSAGGSVTWLLSAGVGVALLLAAYVAFYTLMRRRESLVRRRFEQHLAPAVVRRILAAPEICKLRSERREVTALFTDLEGFTAMTRRADPAVLVATLDSYFDRMATIIAAHGGMIDKIVGDAVHAFFNAPNDLEDHPQSAVECAIALQAWAEAFRRCPEAVAIGFGRTRIGIETGPAIVGDVGIRVKLDYTAHGDAVNVAARLERANKELGSSICIGPVAASRCKQSLLRPLGKITLRGRDDAIAVFEPWRCESPAAWRQDYLAAISLYDEDPRGAADRFDQLAVNQADDEALHAIAVRMRTGKWL
jgi:adenylate cyclase